MLDRTFTPSYHSPEFKSPLLPDKFNLKSGIKVHNFYDKSQKVFKIELNFPVGSTIHSNPAIASICISMLREGTSTKSATEINNILDYYGASLDLRSGLESITISLFGHSDFFNNLIPLLADIVINPIFSEESLVKQKEKYSQKLLINQRKTNYWSPRLLRQNLFGQQHQYSRLITSTDFKNISRNDLTEYHNKYLITSLQHIIVAGCLPTNDVEELINRHFFSIGYTTILSEKNPIIPESQKTIVKHLDDSSQASIALGIKTIEIKDTNYPEYAFFTKVLGGYFGSRLMKNLREDKGLTYGIHAYNIHLTAGSYLQIGADVELKSVNKSIDLIFEEIAKLKNKPISTEELNTVKNYMLGEFVNDSNTIFDFADLYRKLLIYDLPENYYKSFYHRISEVQSEKLLASFSNIWLKESFSVIKIMQ